MSQAVVEATAIQRGWRHPLAFITTGMLFVMILLGATVTTIEAADSDPEWSLRFWEWFRPAQGGLWWELMHRRLGTLIGFVAIGMAFAMQKDPRPRVRRYAWYALGLVVLQGLLGGLRIYVVSHQGVQDFFVETLGFDQHAARMTVAMVHGFSGQVLFVLLVGLTLVTSRGWLSGELPRETSKWTPKMRRLAGWTTVLIFCQLLVGTYIRHGRVFWPEQSVPGHSHALITHIALAIGVVAHIWLCNRHGRNRHPKIFQIWHIAGLALFLTYLQLFLGLGSWVVTLQNETAMPGDVATLIRVGHVGNGAMIFAILVCLTLRSFHYLRPGPQDPNESDDAPSDASKPSSASAGGA